MMIGLPDFVVDLLMGFPHHIGKVVVVVKMQRENLNSSSIVSALN